MDKLRRMRHAVVQQTMQAVRGRRGEATRQPRPVTRAASLAPRCGTGAASAARRKSVVGCSPADANPARRPPQVGSAQETNDDEFKQMLARGRC